MPFRSARDLFLSRLKNSELSAGKLDAVADEVVTIASRLGGSATKGLQDRDRLSVLVDVPANAEQEFRATIEAITAERPGSPTPATTATATIPATGEKKSFVVQIVERPAE